MYAKQGVNEKCILGENTPPIDKGKKMDDEKGNETTEEVAAAEWHLVFVSFGVKAVKVCRDHFSQCSAFTTLFQSATANSERRNGIKI